MKIEKNTKKSKKQEIPKDKTTIISCMFFRYLDTQKVSGALLKAHHTNFSKEID